MLRPLRRSVICMAPFGLIAAAVACGGGSNGTNPTGTVQWSPSIAVRPSEALASVTALPLPSAEGQFDCRRYTSACSAIEDLARLVSLGSPRLADHLLLSDYICPGGTPQGIGGPYPLCGSAQTGETRRGYLDYNDVQGFVNPLSTFTLDMSRVGDDTTKGFDWRPRTISCRAPSCERIMITFGQQDGPNLVSDGFLSFDVTVTASGDWRINFLVSAFIVGDAGILLNGGEISGESLHSAFAGYRSFHRWMS